MKKNTFKQSYEEGVDISLDFTKFRWNMLWKIKRSHYFLLQTLRTRQGSMKIRKWDLWHWWGSDKDYVAVVYQDSWYLGYECEKWQSCGSVYSTGS